MYLIAGLGNPDEKYLKTFHNLGWMAVGDVADKLGVRFRTRQCEAYTAEAFINGERIILARPTTYMNSSGRAVMQLMSKYGTDPQHLIVIYDDFDLPKGHVRIRPSGSAGTHNGMRSVIAETGTSAFPRIRIGIHPEIMQVPLIEYVLSDIRSEDYDLFISACTRAADAAIAIARGETIDNVMSKFNLNS
ncbi:MAG: aminoacyl-tRNA hydrolase [Clostridia bacterium]|nr:aminoacyl-tRNA hydrolase [Clostridia bacterium]